MALLEPKNQFINHGIFWAITLPILALILFPFFFSPTDFVIHQNEIDFFEDVLGRDVIEIKGLSQHIFNTLFVNTGIYKTINELLNSKSSHGANGIELFGSTYNTALWLLIYRAIWRFVALVPAILSIIFCVGIPSFMDGIAVRSRKSYTFGSHNPVIFWTSSHMFIILIGVSTMLPLMPMLLSPWLIACFGVLLCISVWTTAANFQTGK